MANIIQTFPAGSGGSGGGHTILDTEGTAVVQETKLQFEGFEVTDDSTNRKTKVAGVGLNQDSIDDIAETDSIVPAVIIGDANNYSTTEKVIGKWIDGKPVYQKTIYLDSMAFDSSWHNVAHNISNIQRIIEFYGIGTTAGEDEYYSLNSYRPGMDQGFLLMVTRTNIRYMNTWQNASGRAAYITVKYTKTTD